MIILKEYLNCPCLMLIQIFSFTNGCQKRMCTVMFINRKRNITPSDNLLPNDLQSLINIKTDSNNKMNHPIIVIVFIISLIETTDYKGPYNFFC